MNNDPLFSDDTEVTPLVTHANAEIRSIPVQIPPRSTFEQPLNKSYYHFSVDISFSAGKKSPVTADGKALTWHTMMKTVDGEWKKLIVVQNHSEKALDLDISLMYARLPSEK